MTCGDWLDRERGSHDWRLLPVALCGWAASLSAHAGFDYCMTHDGMLGLLPIIGICIVPATVASGLPLLRLPDSFRRRLAISYSSVTVCAIAAVVCSSCALAYDLLQWRDPAFRTAADGGANITIVMRTTTPTVSSDRRSSDCRADARIMSITVNGIRQDSSARVRVYVDRPECSRLRQGGTYETAGAISEAQYGAMPLWLTDVAAVERIRSPNLPLRVIDAMQQAFFAQTSQLPDQGKILVPGLTLGILGQDYVPVEGDGADLDSTYAAQIEDAFRRSGIVHLMAVSGGHLAVVAALVRNACSFFLASRRITAVLVALAYVMLSACVFPSDSVSRALLMGLSGAACLFLGRRGQAMSSLSWTILAMLIACPQMSQSFGFALSCTAVLGIVLFAGTLDAWMKPIMPRFIAEAMSMTISAQVFTLPVQVLIEPELPTFSIPANLVVSPFVGFSTLTGLASLMVSWLVPWLGLQLARVASWGTAVMEITALHLGSGSQATIPWTGGIKGAALVCMVETTCIISAIAANRLFERMMLQEAGLPGKRLIVNPVERLRMWAEHTRKALRELQWEE